MQNARGRVRFLLGSQPTEVELADPNLTLLDYLRTSARLTGTKEGCAEGDCGACTVLIGEVHDQGLRYLPANACIVLLGMVDSKQVLTVEHLAREEIHPVQQAMADQHGSQCGFCTPGFVMSLAGLQWAASCKNESAPVDRAQIDEYLAGNLCRCTGYGPIVNAAREACSAPLPESWRTQATVADTTLRAWQDPAQPLCCRSNGKMFAAPRSRADLQAIVSDHPGATLLAGATDIGLWITKQGTRLSSVIYLGQVPELQRLVENDGKLEIGAGVSLQDASATLSEISPDLNRLLRRFGSRQVRNQGTVGGNIANGSPIGDLPPALIALGAQLRIASTRGVREIPLDAFFIDYGQQDLAPGEFVESVVIPLDRNRQFRCWKISKRFDQDISAVLGAFAAKLEEGIVREVRICFGGMATIPKRARQCEAALIGQPLDQGTLAQARQALAADFDPITDMRASAHYRQRAAGNLLEKYFLAMTTTDLPDLYNENTWPGLSNQSFANG